MHPFFSQKQLLLLLLLLLLLASTNSTNSTSKIERQSSFFIYNITYYTYPIIYYI